LNSINNKEPSNDDKTELMKWLKYMNDLHKIAITTLEHKPLGKSSGKIAGILKYQGTDQRQLKEAASEI
jgi:hypothetical protein